MMNREAWKQEFEGKRILIWGFGREGKSSLKWIRVLCPDLPVDIAEGSVTDAVVKAAEEFGNTRVLAQEHTDFSAYDMVLKSPGIVIPADMDRSNLTQQTHLFLKHHGHQTVGITGTKGKTTTTHMLKALLEAAGHKTGLIGTNGCIIGDKCYATKNTTPESYILEEYFSRMVDAGCEYMVMEVSSQSYLMHRVDGLFFDYAAFFNQHWRVVGYCVLN